MVCCVPVRFRLVHYVLVYSRCQYVMCMLYNILAYYTPSQFWGQVTTYFYWD